MEEQLNELNEIIELINQNIEKVNNVEYGSDYYYINHTFKEKEKKNFEIKQKRKEILEDEKYFYQTKQLVIDILNSFIYSINLNNSYYVLANYSNYNKFTAFVDNKLPIHPRVLEYFKSLGATIMYESCIFFESNLETLIKLLTTKNIEWILIINPNFKLESKLNQKKKN